jgi:hypothetical protein
VIGSNVHSATTVPVPLSLDPSHQSTDHDDSAACGSVISFLVLVASNVIPSAHCQIDPLFVLLFSFVCKNRLL